MMINYSALNQGLSGIQMLKDKLQQWLPAQGIPFRTLIAFCLFSTLTIIASVTLWFYYSNTSFMAAQSTQSFLKQQQELSKLSFESWMSKTKTLVTLARKDPTLLELVQRVQNTTTDHVLIQDLIQSKLNALIEQYQDNDIDLLIFIPSDRSQTITGGYTPYDAHHIPTQLIQLLPNTGFHITLPDKHSASEASHINAADGLVFIEEVVAGKFGKRMGYLAGVIVLNDNFQILNQILKRTEATAAALTLKHQDQSKHLAWVTTDETAYPNYQQALSKSEGLGHFTQTHLSNDFFNQALDIQLWNKNSYLDAHSEQFNRTLWVVIGLILLLGLSIGLFATRVSSQSLKYLSRFAQQKVTMKTDISFQATAITEINHVGERLESAILALTQNEQMYRNILNNSGAIVYIKDLQGLFHFVNTEFECVTGLSLKDVQGKTNEDLFDAEIAKVYSENDQRVAREAGVINFKEDLILKDDNISFISVKFPIRDHNNHIKYICGFSTDITNIIETQKELSLEKERAEQATTKLNKLNKDLAYTIEQKTLELESAQESLVQSEKLASLGALVAGISHELNTPIGTALTVTTTLQERTHQLSNYIASGALSKKVMNNYLSDLDESTQILYSSLNAAIELIASFKQLSVDQTSQQRRVFNLKQTLDEVTTTHKHLLRNTPIQLIDLVEEDVHMDSFPGAIIQVLNNLIQNAMNHAFENDADGKITLTTKVLDEDIEVTLSDNGLGIAADQLHKVFDPFYTTKMGQGGTGLGLHIVHSIITGILGGNVTINSRHGGVNSGTDFLIKLPKVAPVKEPINKLTPDRHELKVL